MSRWLDTKPVDYTCQPRLIQCALFAEPDVYGTPDLFGSDQTHDRPQ